MDANTFEESDLADSQATQMLQELLEPDASSSKRTSGSRSSALKSHLVPPNEVSSDSLPSSRTSGSIPQYHFHGLASTQSQTQQNGEEDEVNEGSQKENIASLRGRSNLSPVSRSSSPHASSSRNHQVKGPQADQRTTSVPANDKATNKKSSTKPAFQAPRAKSGSSISPRKPVTRQHPYKPALEAPTRYKPPPRPVSRSSSRDSFACDPDNTEEAFLTKSEKFAVPLSELGQGSSPVRDPGNATGGTSSSMFAYSVPTRQPRAPSSPPRGRVLVEATPSQSESSQSQSQSQNDRSNRTPQYEETQINEEPEPENQQGLDFTLPDTDGNGSGYESSEPSSSYRRYLRGEPDPEPEPTFALAATQPSTQVDDSNFVEPTTGPTSNPSNPSGPRSLISLVPAAHRHRYENLVPPTPIVPTVPSNSRPANRLNRQTPLLPSTGQDTQPSFPVERWESPMRPPSLSGQSHSSLKPSPSRNPYPPQHYSRGSSSRPMDMDVIPDSEPLRYESVVPVQKARVPSPAKHVQTPIIDTVKDSRIREFLADDVDIEMALSGQDIGSEEEEEDEEDIPLAEAVRKLKGPPGRKPANKGKGKAVEKARPASVRVRAPAATTAPTKEQKGHPVPPGMRGRKAAHMPRPPTVIGGSWETGIVPSSVPEQDNNTVAHSNNANDTKLKAIYVPNSRQSSRSTSAAPKSRLRHQTNMVDSDEEILSAREGENDGTEPADEEYQEEEEEDAPCPSRKRKRAPTKPAPTGKNTRATQKRIKHEAPTPAAARQGRKLRSVASTASRGMNAPGTRVFALWKQDGHYYPGTVHAFQANSRYVIKFDDTTNGNVTLEQMRLCQLKVGDDVLYSNRTRPARVTVVVDDVDNSYVDVDDGDSIKSILIRDLRIAHKTITYAWKDRMVDPDLVSSTLKPVKPKLSPSPSRMSVTSLPATRGNQKKLFGKTGLIVTLSAVNGNWEKEKEKVMNAVKSGGGIVVDELSTIFRMEGKHYANNSRWVLKKEDVQWVGNEEIERIFVLADDPNQKPKFLIGLALGIPCLSTSWLHDSVDSGDEKDWAGYMLPQGYSSALGARPSQQVDVDWGNSIHQLKDIMSNSVACKLFANKNILCVGPEMVPSPKGKRRAGADDKTQEAINAVPQIILAMGADTVEAVTDIRFASYKLKEYNYLIIREENQYLPKYADTECKTVHWTWVKECLIASRLLPFPSWGVEYSQET
ncbi:hypothetical protein GALMADRAFT_239810 [Galerina marginata CBS 339.88]|uniref:BRCT domain-containing protein n=1 Tax=Galerina marginata (strain CBS 339.88) TaxID=685588 RepID=A0A067TH50_GALM3|nr:hypothetical protein GALMADRAFT_239810 [Galerina marginata CBS 339.88]